MHYSTTVPHVQNRAEECAEDIAGHRLIEFSQLAGPVTDVPVDQPYRVAFRGVRARADRGYRTRSGLVVAANVAVELGFVCWLLAPGHLPATRGGGWVLAANIVVVASIALVEGLRLINVVSLSLASVLARDPIPVRPAPGTRVAFLTTIVPGKEPVEMVARTLRAARRITYDGVLDLWLLDEGNSPEVAAMCDRLGVLHFSRKGIAAYNTPSGAFKTKSKHGNYNSWLDSYGREYDVFLSVDPDHVPMPNFAERMLGYFRDPDVAYVVGPQSYANADNFVTLAAESQQFPFHSVIQRAANAYGAAMLVGTNNAIRIEALASIGGLRDSITEDMATGLALHTRRNPRTGRRWRSVYTPDLVAIGEGPATWSDYFSQQLRWSRGTFEVLGGQLWRNLHRLSPGRLMHYSLITSFYPSMALGWILGAVNAGLFLWMGVRGITVPPQLWLALYVDATAFQTWVYIRNRRYNVSPVEREGSLGLPGMAMSVIAAPIFAAALIAAVARRPARFVVTPKGSAATGDRLSTFRWQLCWAALLVSGLVFAVFRGWAVLEVVMWPTVAVAVCLAPVVLWRAGRGAAPADRSVEGRDRSAGRTRGRSAKAGEQLLSGEHLVEAGRVASGTGPLRPVGPIIGGPGGSRAPRPSGPAPGGPHPAGPRPAGSYPGGPRSGSGGHRPPRPYPVSATVEMTAVRRGGSDDPGSVEGRAS